MKGGGNAAEAALLDGGSIVECGWRNGETTKRPTIRAGGVIPGWRGDDPQPH